MGQKWALGENGHQEKRAPEQMGFGQFGQMSSLGKWVFGTNGHVGTGTIDVWRNEHLGANEHFGTNEHWDRGVGVGEGWGRGLGSGGWGRGVGVGGGLGVFTENYVTIDVS